ncbi:calcineurin-like phosphoesterase [Hirsutella rhossiliensis]|uniref:Calcineurin-like phosphoesterase domain-containing protein n=1 Tax=Hirsutella rhossiliensis TaxID=111463 RepID=A0A9P8MVK7_9HYPO|nr:calcineurin-like phosphoesterase domain-containing protein [Hirsutella rhossiliensis]KAH0961974.1 calcineurin-like phosphoesterase domain-containing protein [Hirsutella rhossiliensis]
MGNGTAEPSSKPRPTFSSGRDEAADAPDLRILHYNDVYHVDQASAEPVGGFARFMTLVNEYREDKLPNLLTLFSGDAFNPSLESSVTKGSHMVPVLNTIGTDCACVGNHDLDFGVEQFRHLAEKCQFPWLLANILDPALGVDVPLGNAGRTHMLTTSNGIRVGLIGLGEREWLETINSVPPNLIYQSATATAKELVPKLRQQGADIVICLSHMREPNDNKLAEQTDGIMDIILGGHDHYYSHSIVNGTHVLRSGTDFKQMSYLEARRKRDGSGKWDFDIWRRDVTSDVPEHEPSAKLARHLTSKLQKSLSRPVGWTAMPLDARFSTVRIKESNIGNFVCDVMRRYHSADCTIMAGGTIRGDQIYPPGAVRIKDITNCFPFEDPAILLRVSGQAIWDALENGVSTYPALEGRFPQVSNIVYEFGPSRASGKRLTSLSIGGEQWIPDKQYLLATRGYMGRGKDGFTSLLVKSEGGQAEELVDEEHGILISAMLRQYFMGLQTIGQWKKLSDHWVGVAKGAVPLASVRKREHSKMDDSPGVLGSLASSSKQDAAGETTWHGFLHQRLGLGEKPLDDDEDDHFDYLHMDESAANGVTTDRMDCEVLLLRKFWTRWARKAGVKAAVCDPMKEGEFDVDWTRVIAPRVEGRIKILAS